MNPLIYFAPCLAHSLNLVGSCAAESCQAAVSFFGILQSLYNFFSASTHRWEILLSKLKSNSTVVKSLSQTRWSARADACRSLCCSWDEIIAALQIIANDANEKPSTRSEASGLLNSLDSMKTCFLSLLWNDILERFNKVSKSLQSVNIDLGTIVELYQSLVTYLEHLRKPSTFDHYESKVIEKSDENSYAYDMQRKRKRKVQFDEEKGNETELSGRDRFRVTIFNVIIDRLITKLRRRGTAYEELSKILTFLRNYIVWNLKTSVKETETL